MKKITISFKLVSALFFMIVSTYHAPLFAQISFTRSTLNGTSGLNNPTSLQIGPDGRLYVSEQKGNILIYEVIRNAKDNYSVTATETVSLLQQIMNRNDDGTPNPSEYGRQVTGLYVTGTAANPIIYVGSSDPRIGGGGGGGSGDVNLDTNSGVLSKISWNGSSWEKVDLVRGLPKSEENHSPNGIQIDGNTLYLALGGGTNAGAPSQNFAYICEYALNASILAIDLAAIEAMPTQTDTYGNQYKYDLPTVDDPDRANISSTSGYTDPYDPWGGNDGLNQAKWVDGGPVQVYATGFRNPYDLVITQAGRMYTIDNGANQNWGGYCDNEGPPIGGVSNATNNYVPGEPGYLNNKDGLHYVTGQGYYGGHPNPIRANPTGAGLYTHDGTTGVWRTQTTGPNPLPADWPPLPTYFADPIEGDFQQSGVDDATLINYDLSTNGICEYTATYFNGALQGDLLSVSFVGEIYRTQLSADGTTVTNGVETLVPKFTFLLLDITAQGDRDPFPGTIWICEYGGNNIYIMEPDGNPIFPIEYLSFDARPQGKRIVLKWETSWEVNNAGFEVEMRPNDLSSTFTSIGHVAGQGNANETQTYRFETEELAAATYQFRLKQIDHDGNFSYSRLVEATTIEAPFAIIYPNPTRDHAQLEINLKTPQKLKIGIYDAQGHLVEYMERTAQTAGKHTFNLRTSQLPAGIYVCHVRLLDGQEVSSKLVFVKQ